MSRDILRQLCVDRQDNRCVICGEGMYGDAAIHEAIVKRGDLPADPRVFDEHNCVAIHNGCHENTRQVDMICVGYLARYYGIGKITEWILSLDMKVLPGRAMGIVLSWTSE